VKNGKNTMKPTVIIPRSFTMVSEINNLLVLERYSLNMVAPATIFRRFFPGRNGIFFCPYFYKQGRVMMVVLVCKAYKKQFLLQKMGLHTK